MSCTSTTSLPRISIRSNPGLNLIGWQDDDGAAGRIDLLCHSDRGDIAVVEVKRIAARAAGVVEQTMAYVGWALTRFARQDQQVRGIIAGGKPDSKLQCDIDATPSRKYKNLDISIKDAD